MQDSRLDAWCHALLERTHGVAHTLEAVARYSLGSYAQHMALLTCPGLVEGVVWHINGHIEPRDGMLLGSKDAAAVVLSSQQCERAEAALEATNSLIISKEGLQALVGAGAIEAACVLLGSCCQTMGQARYKKHKHAQGEDVTAACPTEHVHDVMDAALQLLAALLFNPSAARPAVGALSCEGAGMTARLLLQVLPGYWQLLSAKRQLDATSVLMRLAMEPGVAEQLCRQAVPEPDDTAAHPPVPTAGDAPVTAEACHMAAISTGLGSLLGHLPQAQFLASHWELQPVLCRAWQQGPAGSSSGTDQYKETTQEPQRPFTPAVQLLASQLTADRVFQDVLPTAWHCPVLDAAVDPVEVLRDLHDKGCLMQPLQLNTDLRLVQTQPAATATAQCHDPARPPAADQGMEHSPGRQQPVEQQEAHQQLGAARQQPHAAGPMGCAGSDSSAGQEVLCGLDGPVDASNCLAASQAGFTLVLRDMPRRNQAVAMLVEMLEMQLGLPAGANLYITPAGAQGLQAHYDDHDVFVLQLSGNKRWLLAPPQHAPLPLTYQQRLPVVPPTAQAATQQPIYPRLPSHAGQQPAQQASLGAVQLQQGPACADGTRWPQELVLGAGDSLYIPRGWVHEAAATATACPTMGQGAGDSSSEGACVPLSNDHSSLHLSVGLEVDACCSVQGYLHHLIQGCADRVCAGSCSCNTGVAGSCQQLHPLAVSAAALLLHTHLWRHAQACPAYRKACPLLAAGNAAQGLSDAVLRQMQLASCHSTPHKPMAHPDSQTALQSLAAAPGAQYRAGAGADDAAAAAAAGPTTGAAEAAGQDPLSARAQRLQHQPEQTEPQSSHQWVAVAVQKLLQELSTGTASMQDQSRDAAQPEGSTQAGVTHLTRASAQQAAQHRDRTTMLASSCVAELLLGLTREVLGQRDTATPGMTGEDGLLGLSHWLEAAASSSTNSRCPSCSSGCCHSASACAAAVLALHMAGAKDSAAPTHPLSTLVALLQDHAIACGCCQDSARSSIVGYGVVSPQACVAPLHTKASADMSSSVPDAARTGGCAMSAPKDCTAGSGTIGVGGLRETVWSQLQHAALQVATALAVVSASMRCALCRSHAGAGYVEKGRSRLAGCQAVRRGFLATVELAKLL